MCSNAAKKLGLTEKGNRINELRDCIFFRPLSPYSCENECVLAYAVDPHSTYVYDQEYHATKGVLEGEPHMLLHDYLQTVNNLLEDPEWDYIFWPNLFNPCKCRFPYQPHHLKNSRYIIMRSRLGRDIHEVRVFRDKIPIKEFRLVPRTMI